MIGPLIMLGGITAIAWIVVWLDARGRRAERAERAGQERPPSISQRRAPSA